MRTRKYGTEKQNYSLFDAVTSQQKMISNLLNHLSSYIGLRLSLKCRLSMLEISGYHVAYEYYKTKD